jgi:polymorphic membrane protein
MGFAMRTSGGIATAVLMMTGMAVAQPAYARQTVSVPCSAAALVAAVNAANTAGSGTLLLASNCNYVLTAPSAVGRGPDGLLITGNVNIIGGVSTRISRSAAAVPFRIIEVASGAVLGLRNVFISGGLTDPTVPTNDTGGGILNSRGTITLVRTTITGNVADNGAGISNDSGRLIVANTLIQGNSTRASGGGGGGLYNDGSLTIQVSIVRANTANTDGGGLYNGQGGRAELIQSTFDQNIAGGTGGGIHNAADGRLILQRTLVERNTAANGGGIFNAGLASRVTLITSIVRLNTPNNCAPAGSVPGCLG